MISFDSNILVSSRIVHRPLPENDPTQRQPDISLAQKVLDWKPCVPLKEGLVQTVADFERLLFGQGIERAASRLRLNEAHSALSRAHGDARRKPAGRGRAPAQTVMAVV